jgi:hypothetical protein
MKLNLGCGAELRDGFVNIDIRSLDGVDRVLDLREPLPYEKGSIDAIWAKDILEHLPRELTELTLTGWCELLKKGGGITVICPSLEDTFDRVHKKLSKNEPVDWLAVRNGIFGRGDYEHNLHYWFLTEAEIARAMKRGGVKAGVFTYDKWRNLVVQGTKQ